MPSNARVALLVVGIFIALIGAFLWIDNEEDHDYCQSELVRLFAEAECERADRSYYAGIGLAALGGILAFIGIVIVAKDRQKTQYAQYTCPRCQAPLTYQSSPTNCFNCGFPIDWATMQAPQR